jgi:hypothetical protein
MKFARIIKVSLPVIFLFSFASCTDENPVPIENTLIPSKYVEDNFTRTYFHNTAGQLVRIEMVSVMPNGSNIESEQTYTYDANGKLKESSTDTGWRMVYQLTGNLITRTDEYLNDHQLSQYHTYAYDNQGRLNESITWQNIPEEGGEIPVSKDTYEYDDSGNLSYYRLFYYGSFGEGVYPLTVFHYSNYDNRINSERYFNLTPFNPTPLSSKNNPGMMTVQNASGVVSSTEVYTYEYHEKGFAKKKKVDVTFYNGNTGSYTSTYTFMNY